MRTLWRYDTIPTLVKYFNDGRVEVWLSNMKHEKLYLINTYQFPSGKHPIVSLKPIACCWVCKEVERCIDMQCDCHHKLEGVKHE